MLILVLRMLTHCRKAPSISKRPVPPRTLLIEDPKHLFAKPFAERGRVNAQNQTIGDARQI